MMTVCGSGVKVIDQCHWKELVAKEECLQVKEYILQLEAHLAETHRQAQRLIKKQSELGSSLGEFGSSLLGLGKFEQPPLADQFLNMGEKSALLARTSQARHYTDSSYYARLMPSHKHDPITATKSAQ